MKNTFKKMSSLLIVTVIMTAMICSSVIGSSAVEDNDETPTETVISTNESTEESVEVATEESTTEESTEVATEESTEVATEIATQTPTEQATEKSPLDKAEKEFEDYLSSCKYAEAEAVLKNNPTLNLDNYPFALKKFQLSLVSLGIGVVSYDTANQLQEKQEIIDAQKSLLNVVKERTKKDTSSFEIYLELETEIIKSSKKLNPYSKLSNSSSYVNITSLVSKLGRSLTLEQTQGEYGTLQQYMPLMEQYLNELVNSAVYDDSNIYCKDFVTSHTNFLNALKNYYTDKYVNNDKEATTNDLEVVENSLVSVTNHMNNITNLKNQYNKMQESVIEILEYFTSGKQPHTIYLPTDNSNNGSSNENVNNNSNTNNNINNNNSANTVSGKVVNTDDNSGIVALGTLLVSASGIAFVSRKRKHS